MEATYKIPASHIRELQDKIAKINRKSLKLTGSTVIAHVSETTETIKLTYADKVNRCMKTADVECFTVTIEGKAPKLNGYEIMAGIDYIEGKPIFHKVTDEELPAKFRTQGAICDHCSSNRNRLHLYALRDEQGAWHQVGSTCLRDYTGADDPHRVANFLQWLKDIKEELSDLENEPGSRDFRVSLAKYIEFVCTIIRKENGYMSRTRSREIEEIYQRCQPATADIAWTLATGGSDAFKLSSFPKTDEDSMKAAKAILWLNGELAGREGLNDYEHNLTMIGEIGSVGWKETGIAASLVQAYERDIDRPEFTPGHFGEEKKREDFELTVTGLIPNVGWDFETTIVNFKNEKGQAAVWFASNAPELEVGKTYKVRATVKRHGNYKGVDQTIITRCKVEAAQAVSA